MIQCFLRSLRPAAAVAVIAVLGVADARAASVVDDNFNDGVSGPQWTTYVQQADALTVREEGGVLNVVSAGGGSLGNDALYLSQFRLDTAHDFVIRLDYSFLAPAANGPVGTALGVVFGIGEDLAGTKSAAIGQGYGNQLVTVGPVTVPVVGPAVSVSYRPAGTSGVPDPVPSALTAGTFQLSYDSAGDDLTLSEVGGYSYLLADTVRGVWAADSVLVSFGGRGDGFSTSAAHPAFVDNFTVVSGTLVPEPACLTAICLVGLFARRRTSTSWSAPAF